MCVSTSSSSAFPAGVLLAILEAPRDQRHKLCNLVMRKVYIDTIEKGRPIEVVSASCTLIEG